MGVGGGTLNARSVFFCHLKANFLDIEDVLCI